MFLRNAWYVAGWSRDLTDKPIAVRMLDEPVVVWRMANGNVAALEDRCPHRHLPLSMGTPVGDDVRCAYHGMVMNAGGVCVGVASQSLVPPNARVKAYPATERYGWIWVWMGAAAQADAATIPDFHHLTDRAFKAVGKTNHIKCDYRLVADNLMDLSHVGYVHASTIGTPEMAEKGKLKVERTAHGVKVVRIVPDVPPPRRRTSKPGCCPKARISTAGRSSNLSRPASSKSMSAARKRGRACSTDGTNTA